MEGGLELAVGDMLDTLVDAECEVPTGPPARDHLDIFDHAPAIILDHPLPARCPAELVVEGPLQPFLTDVVDVGETDQVGRALGCRVVTMVLPAQYDARYGQRAEPLRDAGQEMTFEKHERLILPAPQYGQQPFGTDVEHSRHLRKARCRLQELAGRGAGRIDRGADRERLPAPVGDHAAMGRQLHHAQMEPRTAVLKDLRFHPL